ncbi:MAG: PAAR domain-containing protein [Pseudomonadota bacterium]
MTMPAARVTDNHVCPMVTGVVPHVGGPVVVPFPTVLIGKMPAATATATCVCVGPPDMIVKGSMKTLTGKKPQARLGDLTSHGGSIVMGCATVLVGG